MRVLASLAVGCLLAISYTLATPSAATAQCGSCECLEGSGGHRNPASGSGSACNPAHTGPMSGSCWVHDCDGDAMLDLRRLMIEDSALSAIFEHAPRVMISVARGAIVVPDCQGTAASTAIVVASRRLAGVADVIAAREWLPASAVNKPSAAVGTLVALATDPGVP